MVNVLGAIDFAQYYVKIHLLTTSSSSIYEIHAIVDNAFLARMKKKAGALSFSSQHPHGGGRLKLPRTTFTHSFRHLRGSSFTVFSCAARFG